MEVKQIQITNTNEINENSYKVAYKGAAKPLSSDTVEITSHQKTKKKKRRRTLIVVGIIAAMAIVPAMAEGLLARKLIKTGMPVQKTEEVFKSLDDIETKFAKLENNLPETQEKFKEIFLRNDLTKQQTLEILRGYKEVEKLGLTCSKKEYVEAVFKEAKKNYRIYSPNMKVEYNNPTIYDNACGVSLSDNSAIYITEHGLSKSRHELFEVIHHELRHSKQGEYIYCCFPDGRFTGDIYHEFLFSKIPNQAEYSKFLDEIVKKTGTEDFCDKKVQAEIDKVYNVRRIIEENMGKPDVNRVPKEYRKIVEQIDKEKGSLIDYKDRVEEKDAFKIGKMIYDLIFK